MGYLHEGTTVQIPNDLLPDLGTALGLLKAHFSDLGFPFDMRLDRLRAEVNQAGIEWLTEADQEYISTAEAAQIMHCTGRSVRKRAEQLGAVKVNGAWQYPRTNVLRATSKGRTSSP